MGVRDEHQREVASLTKCMTVIVSLELFEKYRLEKGTFLASLDIMIKISPSAASLTGTTA